MSLRGLRDLRDLRVVYFTFSSPYAGKLMKFEQSLSVLACNQH